VEPPSASPHHLGRTWLIALLALLLTIGLVAILLMGTLRAVRGDLERARLAMERGRSELLAGDAATATQSFGQGRMLFKRATDQAGGPLLRAVSWIPVAGRTSDAVNAIAGAGAMTADAARVLASALAEVPGGPAGLAPVGGGFPVDLIPPLAEAANEADALMQDALSQLREAPNSLLIGPVASARRTAETQVSELNDKIHSASLLLGELPAFLGADGPRRYFFGAQNPAELRGTGGLIGAYSILTIDDGRFHFTHFTPAFSLSGPGPEDVSPPNSDYVRNYTRFRGSGRFWSAINVMPDFPSVSREILGAYEEATGERLDGVIVADPFALADLLESTGPIQLSGDDVQIDAGNVVAFTTNEAYSLYTDPTIRKRILGDVARAAFERFVAQPSADLGDLQLLLRAATDRHILAYSEEPLMEEGLLGTPVAGSLVPSGADDELLSVVVNSAAGSKVDFYQERDIQQSVALGDDGSAAATLDLVLRNHAPTSGEPGYVIGPFHPTKADGHIGPILNGLEAGESVALVNVYCGADCVPNDARIDGAPIPARSLEDLGIRYVQAYYAIRSGQERSLQVSWDDPNAWEGNSSGGIYRLTFANQVTIRPSTVRIRIQPPDGMRIVSASSPMRIVGGSAVYEGNPGSRLDLEVAFAPPLANRLWRNVTRFLTTPMFQI
jgi:Protein of unknown function (DUF4012)